MFHARIWTRVLAILLATMVPLGVAVLGQGGVTYKLTLTPTMSGSIPVRMEIADGGRGPLEVRLPAWTLGEYVLNSSWENIEGLEAEDASGARLSLTNKGDRGWTINRNGAGPVIVTWTVTGMRALGNVLGYSTGTAVLLECAKTFLYVKGKRGLPCTVEIDAPSSWKVRSSLDAGKQARTFVADGYDQLVEAAVIAGDLTEMKTKVAEVEHLVLIDRQGDPAAIDTKGIVAAVEKVVEAAVAMLGPLPYKKYLFLFISGADETMAYGDAAAVGLGRNARRPPKPVDLLVQGTKEYLRAWNGKRFRPKELRPYDFDKENRTRSLWMTEGATDYLAALVLRRAELVSQRDTLIALTHQIVDHRNHHLSEIVSPEDASWAAWDRLGDDALGISPSSQGVLLGLLLDIRLRAATGGKAGLPELIRTGLERHGKLVGYTSEQLEKLASDVAGTSQASFFESHVRGAKRLPWDETLPKAGLVFNWFMWKVKDPHLRGVMDGGLLVVGPLAEESRLYQAGLRPGDELMYINQNKVKTPDDVDRVIAKLKPRGRLRLDIRHNKKHRTIRLSLEDDVALVIPVEEKNGLILIKSVPPGPLKDAGIKVGDNLEKVDNRRITRTTDVVDALRRVRKGRTLLTYRRLGKRKKVKVKAPQRFYWRGSMQVDPAATDETKKILKGMLGEG